MLLQTNSYIVPKEKRAEHARLMRRFRQVLNRLGCDDFEIYEQVGANWGTGPTSGRFVQIMRFRDRRHQLAVQAAERDDKAAQELIAEFCALINYPYQQQQQQFAVGFYSSVLPVGPGRAPRADEAAAAGEGAAENSAEPAGGEFALAGGAALAAGAAAVAAADFEAEAVGEDAEQAAGEGAEEISAEEPLAGSEESEAAVGEDEIAGEELTAGEEVVGVEETEISVEAAEGELELGVEDAAADAEERGAAEPEMHLADELGLGEETPAENGELAHEPTHEAGFGGAPGHPLDDELTLGDDFKVPEISSGMDDDISRMAEELSAGEGDDADKHPSPDDRQWGTSGSGMH